IPIEQDAVDLPPFTAWDKLCADYDITGLSAQWHPLLLLRTQLDSAILTATQVLDVPHGRWIRTAGLVVCRQRPATAKGVTFLLLEDETGLTNIVVHQSL